MAASGCRPRSPREKSGSLSALHPKRMGSKLKPFRKNALETYINDHVSTKVYGPGSPISGFVAVTPRKDIKLDQITISLVGSTTVHRRGISAAFNAHHPFLCLERTATSQSVLQCGETYTIPFYFTMPDRLPNASCSHNIDNVTPQDCHLQLPPTLGSHDADDMAPEVIQIEYSIKTSIEGCPGEAKKVFRFLPNSPEHPPLDIPTENTEYCLSVVKQLRKGPLFSAQGRLSAFTSQPAAARLDPNSYRMLPFSLPIHLALESTSSKISFPEACSVSARLVTKTWFGERPMSQPPDLARGGHHPYIGALHNAYQVSTSILRDSSFPIIWSSKGFSDYDGSLSHTALLDIPIQVDEPRKLFLPTFHSCLVSRTYVIQLTVMVEKSKMVLLVPIQIALEHKTSDVVHNHASQSLDYGSIEAETLYKMDTWSSHTRLVQEEVLPSYSEYSTGR